MTDEPEPQPSLTVTELAGGLVWTTSYQLEEYHG
jgi:hypothetical protein